MGGILVIKVVKCKKTYAFVLKLLFNPVGRKAGSVYIAVHRDETGQGNAELYVFVVQRGGNEQLAVLQTVYRQNIRYVGYLQVFGYLAPTCAVSPSVVCSPQMIRSYSPHFFIP